MKAFVTGGSGFIGQHLISKLIARGYEVRALARSPQSIICVEQLGAASIHGNLDNLEALHRGMKHCDVVFHTAAEYTYGKRAAERMYRVNVNGTANVLKAAFEEKIPKIVYTSTLAVFGNTHGKVANEGTLPSQTNSSEYDRTKKMAHYQVALPLIQRGAPITIVIPGAVYGAGDNSLIAEMMTLFYKGGLPFFPGPETTLNWAHVADIAEGHILAAEKGKAGESYILAGPMASFQEVVGLWAEYSGQKPPIFYIPAAYLRHLIPFIGALEDIFPLPRLISQEVVRMLGSTYIGCNEKAVKELGWQPRPIQVGMRETIAHLRRTTSSQLLQPRARKKLAMGLITAAFFFTLLWLARRKRN